MKDASGREDGVTGGEARGEQEARRRREIGMENEGFIGTVSAIRRR